MLCAFKGEQKQPHDYVVKPSIIINLQQRWELPWRLDMNPSLRKETGDVLQEKQPIPKTEICIDQRERIQSIFTRLFLGSLCEKKLFFVSQVDHEGGEFLGAHGHPKKVMRAPNNFHSIFPSIPQTSFTWLFNSTAAVDTNVTPRPS